MKLKAIYNPKFCNPANPDAPEVVTIIFLQFILHGSSGSNSTRVFYIDKDLKIDSDHKEYFRICEGEV